MRFYQFGLMSDILEALALIIIIILCIYVGFTIYKQYSKSEKNRVNNNSALLILAERYAKGEITDDEYEHRKSVLIGIAKIKKADNIINKKCININNELME